VQISVELWYIAVLQRHIESEDAVEEERKSWSQKVQSLEIENHRLEIKLRNVQEHGMLLLNT